MIAGVDGKPSLDGEERGLLSPQRGLLREHDRAKLELAELVREVESRAGTDRFNVAMVGRFSRGKTTRMNAVLGTDRLPTGVLPLTSVITMVRCGSRERAYVYHSPGSFPYEIPLDRVPEYVTQAGNPGNRRGVHHVEVQIPSEPLRQGVSFVDTPGLGSREGECTALTEGFSPEMDAVVIVTSFDAALSAEEMEFIRRSVRGDRKTFLVVDKRDLVGAEEAGKVLHYMKDALAGLPGADGIGPNEAIPSRILEIRDEVLDRCAREVVAEATDFPDSTRSDAVRSEQSCSVCSGMFARVRDYLCGLQYRLGDSREARPAAPAAPVPAAFPYAHIQDRGSRAREDADGAAGGNLRADFGEHAKGRPQDGCTAA